MAETFKVKIPVKLYRGLDEPWVTVIGQDGKEHRLHRRPELFMPGPDFLVEVEVPIPEPHTLPATARKLTDEDRKLTDEEVAADAQYKAQKGSE